MTAPAKAGGAGLPLHGTKTHPLKPASIKALRILVAGDRPAREFNPGVCDRLMREALAEPYPGPSPYKTVKGAVVWFRITDLGRSRLFDPSPTPAPDASIGGAS